MKLPWVQVIFHSFRKLFIKPNYTHQVCVSDDWGCDTLGFSIFEESLVSLQVQQLHHWSNSLDDLSSFKMSSFRAMTACIREDEVLWEATQQIRRFISNAKKGQETLLNTIRLSADIKEIQSGLVQESYWVIAALNRYKTFRMIKT